MCVWQLCRRRGDENEDEADGDGDGLGSHWLNRLLAPRRTWLRRRKLAGATRVFYAPPSTRFHWDRCVVPKFFRGGGELVVHRMKLTDVVVGCCRRGRWKRKLK